MQDFFKQQIDWLKGWQVNQENLNKQYAGWSEEWMGMLGKKKDSGFFEGWQKGQKDLEAQFKEFSKRLNEMISKSWSGKISPEALKFLDMTFFEEFYKNWLSSLEMPGGVKNPLGMDAGWQQATGFLRTLLEKDNPFFSSFSANKVADQLSHLFGLLQGALGKEKGVFGDILGGYQELFGKLFESTSALGIEKLSESFKFWSGEMEKHLSAPKLGINRELAQEISHALVLSQDYVKKYCKMARLVEETSRRAGGRFQTKLSELALSGKPVDKFVDLCALWAVENETVFLEVMGTEGFATLQGEFIDAGNRLKIQGNKLAEKALESTPIALKRDLDLAIGEIQLLKREMRTFRRELKDARQEALEARNAQAAASEEVKKAKAAAKAAEVAAQEETKKAKAAIKAVEVAAREEIKQAKAELKSAEAANREKAKKEKAASVAPAKRAKNTDAPLLSVVEAATITESRND